MQIPPFKLERYFAKFEFTAKYMLSSSDCDGLSVKYLLSLADTETKNLWENLSLGYTESLGLPLLRDEVAKLYQRISKDDVLIITPEEGILIALNCMLNQGDHIICTSPGYQSLYQIAESLGVEVTKWLPEEENGWRFNPEFLKKNIKSNTKLIVFNFPHNPTGCLPSKEDYQKIIEIAKKHNLYVFSDEMYQLLEYNPEDRLTPAAEIYEKAVSLFGMSKTFGMAGARIGWVATKDKELYQKIMVFKDYTTICSSAPSEILSLIALRSKEIIINDNLIKIKKNLSLADDFFKKYKNYFSWVRPKAGTIGFPKILFNTTSSEFASKLVSDTGIMILPSTVYDHGNEHFRIGLGRENFPEVLKLFEEYLKKNYFK